MRLTPGLIGFPPAKIEFEIRDGYFYSLTMSYLVTQLGHLSCCPALLLAAVSFICLFYSTALVSCWLWLCSGN